MNKLLTTGDLLFLGLEKRQQPMHIGGLFLFKKPENAPEDFVYNLVEDIRKSEAPPVDPFNRLLHKNIRWREDDDFEIDHHFRHIALPKPGRIRELLVYVSKEHSSLLEKKKPLWECHIIEGIEGDRFAMYFKIHHAVLDGVAAIRIVKKALSTSPTEMRKYPFWSIPKPERSMDIEPKVTIKKTANQQGWDIAKLNFGTLPTVSKELVNNLKNHNNPNFIKPHQTPASILNKKITSARRIAAQSYKIERFKRIAKFYQLTINDVVLAVCSGVLRNYLNDLDKLPKKPLTAFVPISLRKDDSDVGNQISFMLTNLATNIADPEQRLKTISASIQENKERFSRMNQQEIINYSMVFYGVSMLNLVTGVLPKKQGFNLIISNVPGSAEPLYWNGAKLDALYPLSVLMDGQALNITLTSYIDKIEFGIVANNRSLPHTQNMLELLENEITLYEKIIDEQ